ncbi:MAG: DUF1697 domain-containing protein [Deltaproteobacteria bacterium]|nr:DUF1697 domain-containing protein [Deltaproteobacteria bacterium]
MTSYIALLRGVNVGGHRKLPMAELKAKLTELGHRNVRTLLASGNVVVDADQTTCAALEKKLEADLHAAFGLSTEVFVRDPAEWDAIVAANPFPQEAKACPSHTLVMAFKETPSTSARAFIKAWTGPELVHIADREAFLFFGAGQADSKLNLTKLGVGTARNWNTVLKLQAMLSSG